MDSKSRSNAKRRNAVAALDRAALPIVLLLVTVACGCNSGESRAPSSPEPSSSGPPSSTGGNDTAVSEGSDSAATATTGPKPAKGGWGTLRGRFVYDGDPPARTKIIPKANPDVCGKHDLRAENLVVDENGGIADIMIWLRTQDTPIHVDYEAAADAAVELDNKNCRFAPHVVTLRLGQKLNVLNSDPVGHNTKIEFTSNKAFNEQINPKQSKEITPQKLERLPVPIKCSIHPWMNAFMVLQDTPYMAVTAADGSFEINNLPTGIDLEFQVYHQDNRITEVTRDGKAAKWKRGRFTIPIAEGDNDMKDLLVSPAQFEK